MFSVEVEYKDIFKYKMYMDIFIYIIVLELEYNCIGER